MSDRVLLVGCGSMGVAYHRALEVLGLSVDVIGRSSDGCKRFQNETGVEAKPGGLTVERLYEYQPSHVILAVSCSELASCVELVTRTLPAKVLVEKPGADFSTLLRWTESAPKRVFVAYNRRFLPSVIELRKRLCAEGPLKAVDFVFSERVDRISSLAHPKTVLAEWLLFNSSHVIDLAFYLSGLPVDLRSEVTGSLAWHPSASVFSGNGVSERGTQLSYSADWTTPGHWRIEVETQQNRYRLAPLENLEIQVSPSEWRCLVWTPIARLKPGLVSMLRDFFSEGPTSDLVSLEEQIRRAPWFARIAGLSPDHGANVHVVTERPRAAEV